MGKMIANSKAIANTLIASHQCRICTYTSDPHKLLGRHTQANSCCRSKQITDEMEQAKHAQNKLKLLGSQHSKKCAIETRNANLESNSRIKLLK